MKLSWYEEWALCTVGKSTSFTGRAQLDSRPLQHVLQVELLDKRFSVAMPASLPLAVEVVFCHGP